MNAKLSFLAPRRTSDSFGSGHYGAPRGSRIHSGIDFAARPHSLLLSPIAGEVTKLGYPYSDDMEFRYVEVTDSDGLRHRFFYIFPGVAFGETIDVGDPLGTVQDLEPRYPGITPHAHYEIRQDPGNLPIDPDEYWA